MKEILKVGGGTVFFVGDTWHRYLENLEEREEGGTPDIVGAVRAVKFAKYTVKLKSKAYCNERD